MNKQELESIVFRCNVRDFEINKLLKELEVIEVKVNKIKSEIKILNEDMMNDLSKLTSTVSLNEGQ